MSKLCDHDRLLMPSIDFKGMYFCRGCEKRFHLIKVIDRDSDAPKKDCPKDWYGGEIRQDNPPYSKEMSWYSKDAVDERFSALIDLQEWLDERYTRAELLKRLEELRERFL